MAFAAADRFCRKKDEIEYTGCSELAQELEVLKEIYITELSVNHNSCGQVESLDVQLHPSTGENTDQKWVFLTLHITPLDDYPHSVPNICIRGPRGLAEEHVASMMKNLNQIAEDRKGSPMIYELIEYTKESLTKLNVPYGCCMICLEDFDCNEREFTKTECYHYFHCSCLALYLHHCKTELKKSTDDDNFLSKPALNKLICPVCREPLPSHLDLSTFVPEKEAESSLFKYTPSIEMEELQRKMAEVYEKQKQKGGIIDLEEEKNKYLLPKDFVYRTKQDETDLPANDQQLSDSTAKADQVSNHEKISRGYKGSKGERGNRNGRRGDGERKEFGRRGRIDNADWEEFRNKIDVDNKSRRGDHGRERGGSSRSWREDRDLPQYEDQYRNRQGQHRKPGPCEVHNALGDETLTETTSTIDVKESASDLKETKVKDFGCSDAATQKENSVASKNSTVTQELRKMEERKPQLTAENWKDEKKGVRPKQAPYGKKTGHFMGNAKPEEGFKERYSQRSNHRRHQDNHLHDAESLSMSHETHKQFQQIPSKTSTVKKGIMAEGQEQENCDTAKQPVISDVTFGSHETRISNYTCKNSEPIEVESLNASKETRWERRPRNQNRGHYREPAKFRQQKNNIYRSSTITSFQSDVAKTEKQELMTNFAPEEKFVKSLRSDKDAESSVAACEQPELSQKSDDYGSHNIQTSLTGNFCESSENPCSDRKETIYNDLRQRKNVFKSAVNVLSDYQIQSTPVEVASHGNYCKETRPKLPLHNGEHRNEKFRNHRRNQFRSYKYDGEKMEDRHYGDKQKLQRVAGKSSLENDKATKETCEGHFDKKKVDAALQLQSSIEAQHRGLSYSDNSSERHPGFRVQSIRTADVELAQKLDP